MPIAQLAELEAESETPTGTKPMNQVEVSVRSDLGPRYVRGDACRSGSHTSSYGGAYA